VAHNSGVTLGRVPRLLQGMPRLASVRWRGGRASETKVDVRTQLQPQARLSAAQVAHGEQGGVGQHGPHGGTSTRSGRVRVGKRTAKQHVGAVGGKLLPEPIFPRPSHADRTRPLPPPAVVSVPRPKAAYVSKPVHSTPSGAGHRPRGTGSELTGGGALHQRCPVSSRLCDDRDSVAHKRRTPRRSRSRWVRRSL
jgi:hypothetical protein